MKIVFFTEGKWCGKIRPEQCGRTDANWIFALDAVHFPLDPDGVQIFDGFTDQLYDLGIIIVPKKNPSSVFDKRRVVQCKKWAVMQEGQHQGFQDYEMIDQINYLNLLNEVNLILCHNEQDKLYFEGLFPEKTVRTFPSLLIESSLPRIPYEDRSGSFISGNMSSWYGGMDSFIVGQILTPEEVYAPSMGRRIANEEQLEGLTHLPYMNWQQWFLELNKRKYGVNLMRTFAAGSFSLACARLKIPCIGWGRVDENNPEGTDTQRLLFPQLTIPTGNMKEAARVAKHLKENQLFYDHCAEYAFAKYMEIYSEKIFIDKFNQSIKGI